jgi:hypothetical protein
MFTVNDPIYSVTYTKKNYIGLWKFQPEYVGECKVLSNINVAIYGHVMKITLYNEFTWFYVNL